MKLMGYTLMEIDECIKARRTNRVRDQMTDNWGATYGVVRDSLSRQQEHAAA
ncbi:MAG TPA: hypothetical protein VF736_23565 [Pyrinomonadaceae bacterium]